MKILALRPAPPGGNVIARFDLETDDGIKVRDLKLIDGQAGWRVFAPKVHGQSIITFPAAVVHRITSEALRHVRTGS